jgi:hypothetical protein
VDSPHQPPSVGSLDPDTDWQSSGARSRIVAYEPLLDSVGPDGDGVSHHSQPQVDDEKASPEAQAREGVAVNRFLKRFTGFRVDRNEIQKLFESDDWRNYWQYNDHLQKLEPTHDFVVSVSRPVRRLRSRGRGRSSRVRFHEDVQMKYHPENHMRKKALEVSKQYDDFRRVHEHSEQAQVGEYISLNILPAMLYITIRKNVQMTALKIISKQLVKHFRGESTRVLLKHSPKTGKFSYKTWLTSDTVSKLDESGLLARFLNATKDGKKTIQIIVRQNIAKGKIQELWTQKHSLL